VRHPHQEGGDVPGSKNRTKNSKERSGVNPHRHAAKSDA